MPGLDHVGVSRRIEDRDERQRIKAIIQDLKPKGVGLIARTAGEGKGDPDFAADVKHLVKTVAEDRTARPPACTPRRSCTASSS